MDPHFPMSFDKSTPHRETNRAIVVMAVNDRGQRVAYFLDAPPVYSKEKGEQIVSGGQSQSLATQNCVGAVADGQY